MTGRRHAASRAELTLRDDEARAPRAWRPGRRPGRTTTSRASARWLDRTLELKHRYIDCFPPSDDPYDTLLDDFEPGMQHRRGAAVFDRLRPTLRELVAGAPDDGEPEAFLEGTFRPRGPA